MLRLSTTARARSPVPREPLPPRQLIATPLPSSTRLRFLLAVCPTADHSATTGKVPPPSGQSVSSFFPLTASSTSATPSIPFWAHQLLLFTIVTRRSTPEPFSFGENTRSPPLFDRPTSQTAQARYSVYIRRVPPFHVPSSGDPSSRAPTRPRLPRQLKYNSFPPKGRVSGVPFFSFNHVVLPVE